MALADTFQSFVRAESTALMTGFRASASLAAISRRASASFSKASRACYIFSRSASVMLPS